MSRPQITQEKIDLVKALANVGLGDHKIRRVTGMSSVTVKLIRNANFDLETYKKLQREFWENQKEPKLVEAERKVEPVEKSQVDHWIILEQYLVKITAELEAIHQLEVDKLEYAKRKNT